MIREEGEGRSSAIAHGLQCGRIEAIGEAMTGEELRRIADEELARLVREVVVFACIMPEQKVRVVNAFKANGEIVAMTGDGVNDAPSLHTSLRLYHLSERTPVARR
jgi:Ca2+-transporting ATPase